MMETSALPPGEPEYHVVYSEAVREALSSHIDALLKSGWPKKSVLALVEKMDQRLKRSPSEFGEPHYTLHTRNIRVSIGFVRPLSIKFGIHEESKSVLVGEIILMTTNLDT